MIAGQKLNRVRQRQMTEHYTGGKMLMRKFYFMRSHLKFGPCDHMTKLYRTP